MSTSETVTFDANVCPCGGGKILKHVTTQDNPWSSADIAYELGCESCRNDWVIERSGALVSRSSEARSNAAHDVWWQSVELLQELVQDLVNNYFVGFAAKSKKAEWQEMQRLDIYVGSYRSFLQCKSDGRTPGEISFGQRNRSWLSSLAKRHNCNEKLDQLIVVCDARKKEWEEAAKKIVRWSHDSPK